MWLKDFIFEQKCIPWRIIDLYCKVRNRILNVNTKNHWDFIWATEKLRPRSHRFYPVAFKHIISLIESGKSVVDIGCGIGILLARLKIEKKCEVTGIDISNEAITSLKEKNIHGVVARVPPIPLPSDSFDYAVATEILEHVCSPNKLIQEMLRIIKPSGSIIVSVPNNALHPHTEREHIHSFNKEVLSKMFLNLKKIKDVYFFEVKETGENFSRLILRIIKT